MALTLSALRRRGTALAALAAVLGAGAVTAAPAQAAPEGIYVTPFPAVDRFSPERWATRYFSHYHARVDGRSVEIVSPLSGAIPPSLASRATPVPTEYVHYAWSPDIYAVGFLGGELLWTKLSLGQWQSVGFPQPRIAGHIQGTEYFMFPGFSEIFAGLNGVGHELTPQEWAASGYQTPVVTAHETFKLSWTPEIASYDVDADGVVATVLTYGDWVAEGSPQPWVMPTLPGDEVCTVDGSPDLVYSGATFEGVLTYGQWQAAGFPTPTCSVEPAA